MTIGSAGAPFASGRRIRVSFIRVAEGGSVRVEDLKAKIRANPFCWILRIGRYRLLSRIQSRFEKGKAMANLAQALKQEILRLARKEVKVQLAATRKASTRHRREIAELKRYKWRSVVLAEHTRSEIRDLGQNFRQVMTQEFSERCEASLLSTCNEILSAEHELEQLGEMSV